MDDVKQEAAKEVPSTAVVEAPNITVPKNANDYAQWRLTGKLPDAPKAAAVEADTSHSESSKDDGKGVPVPETGNGNKPGAKARSTAASRLDEILKDLKTAGLSPSELKTFKRDSLQNREHAIESKPVLPEKTVKPLERPTRPKYADFDGDDAKYEAALDAHEEQMAEYKASQAIEQFKRDELTKAERKEMTAKLDEAKLRYGDESAGIIIGTVGKIVDDAAIPIGLKTLINESPVLTDLMYVMGQDEAELDEFMELARTQPGAAVRRVILVERLVIDELNKKAKARDNQGEADEKPIAASAPSKKITKIFEPPEEVGGNKGSLPDGAREASQSGDFAKYRKEKNLQDLARMRGV